MDFKVGDYALVQIADGHSDRIYIIKVDTVRDKSIGGKALNPKITPWHNCSLSFWHNGTREFKILRKVNPKNVNHS